MQFVRNGPDVPAPLLQAHEDGRVVFFCGAGISVPAGLPSFGGLVEQLYAALTADRTAAQKTALKAGQLDTAIGLLETRVQRDAVRAELVKILESSSASASATATHSALLTLSQNRQGITRLITTNFDRLFERIISPPGQTVPAAPTASSIPTFKAPLLPVPNTRWDGIVYLHGLLSSAPTPEELNCLVLSSGDFGLAYLTQRWAARFITDLFRSYTVCFVGYSLNDPVLRYMTDALAADRLMGESNPEMYAFACFSQKEELATKDEWSAKNVTPILYKSYRKHHYLHATLKEWSKMYRDGVQGKENIVVHCARTRPLMSTAQDDLVGRLLWAISDETGIPARRFAEFNPVPSLAWLDAFEVSRFGAGDLKRFGIDLKNPVDKKLEFSLVNRPSPHTRAPWMTLLDGTPSGSEWDRVMWELAAWLGRHLNNPVLLRRLARRNGRPSQLLAARLRKALDAAQKLELEQSEVEILRIRANAPDAIPSMPMRRLWELWLSGRMKHPEHHFDLYSWKAKFKASRATVALRLELRDLLAPRISIREPYRMRGEDEAPKEKISSLVEWEIVLASDSAHTALADLAQLPEIADLLSDATQLLHDALDLMSALDGASDTDDLSRFHQPSIVASSQNRTFHDWTVLIVLARDAWSAAARTDIERAERTASQWWATPYLTFKRLALFAACSPVVPVAVALSWLLSDDWLWSLAAKREVMRLLIALTPRLSEPMVRQLESAIVQGPASELFRSDLEADDLALYRERMTWVRLAKMQNAGGQLTPESAAWLSEAASRNPSLRLAEDQGEEFSIWLSSHSGSDEAEVVATPKSTEDLVAWLRSNPKRDAWQDTDWPQRCRDEIAIAWAALEHLAVEGVWPDDAWGQALDVWSGEDLIEPSWQLVSSRLTTAPDEVIVSASQWLGAVAKKAASDDPKFVQLCRRVIAAPFPLHTSARDPLTSAINHPVGKVTEALLMRWYRKALVDNEGLPEDLREIFSELCDTDVDHFKHGRVLLAAHVVTLFRVDRGWTSDFLVPLFDWGTSRAARAAWMGFLWSPRLYRPLLEILKTPFLKTAEHYAELGDAATQYAALLTFAALDKIDTFTEKELSIAVGFLPSEGLNEVARSLKDGLEAAESTRSEYWEHRVFPFLRRVWPHSAASEETAERLAQLCLEAQEEFQAAFDQLRPKLHALRSPHYVVSHMGELGLCRKFPKTALAFLAIVVNGERHWIAKDLARRLDEIEEADASLSSDSRFAQLRVYARNDE